MRLRTQLRRMANNMKIKAYSLERNSYDSADIKSAVIKHLTDSSVYFESFGEPEALFSKLSQALGEADALLIGVQTDMYLKFKPVLIKAFEFTPAYSERIEERIGSAVTDEKVLKAHLLVPNECRELLSPDGLYSAFYVKSSSQVIAVFPLNGDAAAMLEDSALPFIKKKENKEDVFAAITGSAAASQKARELVAKLLRHDIKLAVPSTPASNTLKEDIKKCPNYENNVFFTPFVNDDGATDAKNYSAQLSRNAMQLRSADLGATISNIYREKDGDTVKSYYAFISVAIGEKVIVRKLYAEASESVDNLITEATSELYTLIDKNIDEVIFRKTASPEEIEQFDSAAVEAELKAEERPAASLGRNGTIIASAILAVAVIICIFLGFKLKGYFVGSSDIPENSVLQNGETFDENIIIPQTQPQSQFTLPDSNTETATEPSTENEITVFSSVPESSTSIFDPNVTLTNPPPQTNYNPIHYDPPATQAPQRQEPQTTPPTTEPATQAPTESMTEKPTQAPTEKPTEEPTTVDDGMVHGEM